MKTTQSSPHSNSSLANSIFQNIIFSEKGSEGSWGRWLQSTLPPNPATPTIGGPHRAFPNLPQ